MMTNEEIIELANKFDSYCSMEFYNGSKYECYEFAKEQLIYFARLVAAAELRKMAASFEKQGWSYGADDLTYRADELEGKVK